MRAATESIWVAAGNPEHWEHKDFTGPEWEQGPKTAVLAGAAMWFMNYGLGGSFPVVTHLFPLGLAAVTTLIGLVEVVVAGLAGAWVYREASQPEVKQFSQAARR